MEEDCNYQEVKKEINNLLWTYLPKNTSLEKAEDIACKWFQDIIQAKKSEKG